ncbi:MAG: hypothetical protein MAG451_02927 [Anaerolineales bacterium]|nr:hypothetical protein [Anaerolineales bacterium]
MSQQIARYWRKFTQEQMINRGLGLLRIVYGIYWMYHASWKVPPDFGQIDNTGLWFWISQGAEYPTFDWYHAFLESFVLQNFTLVGYLVLLVESTIGLSLFLGVFTRLGTLLGVLVSINIMLTVASVPSETVWFYIALIGLHLLLGITRSGRFFGTDNRLAQRLSKLSVNGSPVAAFLLRFT